MPESISLRWSAYEHEHIERGQDWYWALGVIAISIAIISVLLNDILFGLLIIVAAFTLALLARRPPHLVEFELSDRGIKTGQTLHLYEEILAFWVEDQGEATPVLLVDTTKLLAPNLIIPLEGIDPTDVRAYLKEHIEEIPMKEPIAHKILEFFGL